MAKHFLFLLILATSSSLAASVKDLTFEEFDSQFRCPETYLNDNDRMRNIEESIAWFAAHYTNATPAALAEFRISLLTKHKCEVTLRKIQTSNERALLDSHSCNVAIHDFLLISNAISEYGCKRNLLTKSTRDYLDLIDRFSSQKCSIASLPDLDDRIESVRQENMQQYASTKKYQPQDQVKSVFCKGFNIFSLRRDLFQNLMPSHQQSGESKQAHNPE